MLILSPSVCTDLSPLVQIIGWILFVFKIVIPILVIVFGMIDLGKAVVASKDDEIKKAVKQLALRAIAGIIIFFVPTLVGAIFRLIGEFKNMEDEFNTCRACITNPGGDKCNTAVDRANGKIDADDDTDENG